MDRRSFLALSAALGISPQAFAQANWPNGPVKLVAAFPPGGSVDAMARLAQPGLQERLAVPMVVENRGGASGAVGANVVAKSAPDGQTWLFVFDTHGVNPSLQPNMPFDTMKDLDPVMLIGKSPMVITTHPSKPYQTFKDVIEASKTGPGINYGTIGNGSLGHLAMTLLAKASGARMNHIPYRGGGPLVNDSIAGHIEISIASVPNFAQQIAGKMLRPLLQTGATRVATLADTPTAVESGFPGFDAPAWWAVFAPAGTPAPIIEKFRNALVATYNDAETRRRITETQQMQLVLSSPEELRTFLASEIARWSAVVRENNIKAD